MLEKVKTKSGKVVWLDSESPEAAEIYRLAKQLVIDEERGKKHDYAARPRSPNDIVNIELDPCPGFSLAGSVREYFRLSPEQMNEWMPRVWKTAALCEDNIAARDAFLELAGEAEPLPELVRWICFQIRRRGPDTDGSITYSSTGGRAVYQAAAIVYKKKMEAERHELAIRLEQYEIKTVSLLTDWQIEKLSGFWAIAWEKASKTLFSAGPKWGWEGNRLINGWHNIEECHTPDRF